MSIFGTSYPKFVYDHGGAGETTVSLPRAVIQDSEPTEKFTEHVSEIARDREFLHVATHWRVRMLVHLWKYPSTLAAYQEMAVYKGTYVSLWLHSDGEPFKTAGGDDARFLLKDVKPLYISDRYEHDAVMLDFESVDPILQRTTYDASILVFDVAPGYVEKEFYLPVKPTTEDYFLYAVGLDGSRIDVVSRGERSFTITPAMDGGAVRVLFVDESINLTSDHIRVGAFSAPSGTPAETVTFPTPISDSDFVLLCETETSTDVITSGLTVNGFDVYSNLGAVSGWYLAVDVAAVDEGNISIRAGSETVSPDSPPLSFSSAMPSDTVLVLAVEPLTRQYVSVEDEDSDGFTAVPLEVNTAIFYAAFAREDFITP